MTIYFMLIRIRASGSKNIMAKTALITCIPIEQSHSRGKTIFFPGVSVCCDKIVAFRPPLVHCIEQDKKSANVGKVFKEQNFFLHLLTDETYRTIFCNISVVEMFQYPVHE